MASEDDGSDDGPFRQSPLYKAHVALGAKMVPFGGWEMPLAYPLGTLAEHRACRASAVVFDVSHLGTVRVTGPDAFDHLQYSLSNDLRKISPGRAQYTHLLDVTGSVTDDIIVWWVDRGPLRRDAQCVEHQPGGGGHRRKRCDGRAGDPGRAGPPGPCAAGHGRAGGGRGAPLRRGPLHLGGRHLPGGRDRLHRRGRGRVRRAAPRRRRSSGRPSWRPGSPRPDWVHATRCASKRGCRYTVTSSDRASRRSRRSWGGSWAGPRGTSSGVPHWKRRGRPARRAGCAAWWARGVSLCATTPRSMRAGATSAG